MNSIGGGRDWRQEKDGGDLKERIHDDRRSSGQTRSRSRSNSSRHRSSHRNRRRSPGDRSRSRSRDVRTLDGLPFQYLYSI